MTRTATTIFSILALAAVPATAAAKSADANHNGIPDKWEKAHHLSVKSNQANKDTDHDGLSNRQEFKDGTDPRKADSDRDGLKDGAEVATGNDPTRRDTDGDGTPDGRENAGMVVSMANGVLTMKLANGSTISGNVNDARMTCESEAEHAAENEAADNHHGGKAARAARNGNPSDTTASPPADNAARHNGNDAADNGNENENEPAENENETHQSGNCAGMDIKAGTMVHKAKRSGGSFSDIELVHS